MGTAFVLCVRAHMHTHASFSAVAGVSTVGFGEIDRSVQEDKETTIQVDLFGPNVDNISLRVFPVTVDEFYSLYNSTWTVTQAVQDRLDAIRDPAECTQSSIHACVSILHVLKWLC